VPASPLSGQEIRVYSDAERELAAAGEGSGGVFDWIHK